MTKKPAAQKPLGRWHRWWLEEFKAAHAMRGPKHTGGLCAAGWEGTVQGRALAGLLDRGLVSHECSFENGAASLRITEKGLAA